MWGSSIGIYPQLISSPLKSKDIMESKEDGPPEASGKSINLLVRAIDGTLTEFIVTADSPVQNLKDRIADSAGVPLVMLRLLFEDRELGRPHKDSV